VGKHHKCCGISLTIPFYLQPDQTVGLVVKTIRLSVGWLVWCFVWIGSLSVTAQKDTTILSPYVVNGVPFHHIGGANHEVFDSLQRMMMRDGSLADLLVSTHPVAIKYYGPGQLATAAFRGAAASQTVVVWNGIRINNPMLMQADFSTLPLSVFSGGGIRFGGATLRDASGAFGGVVSLTSGGDDDGDTSRIFLHRATGSYGSTLFQAGVNLGSGSIISRTFYYTEQSKNDYLFSNNFTGEADRERRINGGWFRQGVLHRTGYRGKGGLQAEVLLWGQHKMNHIPYPLHQPQGRYAQHQTDDAWRLLLSGEAPFRGMRTYLNTGLQHASMHYVESRSGVDARHITNNFQQRAGLEGETIRSRWEMTLDYEVQQAVTTAYEGTRHRHITAFYGSYIRNRNNILWYGIQGRGEWVPGYGIDLMPALVAGVSLDQHHRNLLRASLQRNRQLPGLNDLYWVPGGNSALQPETGYSADITLEGSLFRKNNLTLKHQLTAFHQQVAEKIVWLPDNTAIWRAQNIGDACMTGIEVALMTTLHLNQNHMLRLDLKGSFTRAVKINPEKNEPNPQLLYVPRYAAAAQLFYVAPRFVLSASTTYTAKRYVNMANTNHLPVHYLTQVRLMSKPFKLHNYTCSGYVSVHNLLDEDYQMIAWYPMPGTMNKSSS